MLNSALRAHHRSVVPSFRPLSVLSVFSVLSVLSVLSTPHQLTDYLPGARDLRAKGVPF